MAGEFLKMTWNLRLVSAIECVVQTKPYADVSKKGVCQLAKIAVKSEFYWKSMLSLVVAVYPLLELLRIGDKRKNGIDKVYYYVCKSDDYIRKSIEIMNELECDVDCSDLEWIKSVKQKCHSKDLRKDFDGGGSESSPDDETDVIIEEQSLEEKDSGEEGEMEATKKEFLEVGEDHATKSSGLDDGRDKDGDYVSGETFGFGYEMQRLWKQTRDQITHIITVTAWALSPDGKVREHVAEIMNGKHRKMIGKFELFIVFVSWIFSVCMFGFLIAFVFICFLCCL